MRSVALIIIVFTGVLCFGLGSQSARQSNPSPPSGRKCVGADPCLACKNCSSCKYCKAGGTCGTCKPATRKSEP